MRTLISDNLILVSSTKHWLDVSSGDCCSSPELRRANVAFEVDAIGRRLPVLRYRRLGETVRTGYRRLTRRWELFAGRRVCGADGAGCCLREATVPRNFESSPASVM